MTVRPTMQLPLDVLGQEALVTQEKAQVTEGKGSLMQMNACSAPILGVRSKLGRCGHRPEAR